jgi:hypothetical protein
MPPPTTITEPTYLSAIHTLLICSFRIVDLEKIGGTIVIPLRICQPKYSVAKWELVVILINSNILTEPGHFNPNPPDLVLIAQPA